jgi:alkylation response protein AidB-like acyl-CoA dehydrogenase
MTVTQAPSTEAEPTWSTDFSLLPTPSCAEEWIERAKHVGRILASDVVEREKAAKTPYAEVALLKESGLSTLLGPVEHGGGGQEWPTAYHAIRHVAAGDGSIGHLLAYHLLYSWTLRLIATAEQVERLEAQATRNRLFFAGAVNARDADVVVRDEGDHLVFNGKKNFATGVKISDRTLLEGVIDGSDTHVFVLVPTDQPGIIHHDNWDNMGQRLTESGGVTIKDVRVRWEDALGFRGKVFQPWAYGTMNVPTGQPMFGNLWLGIARGALAETVRYTRERGGPWGGYRRTVDEPRVQDLIGDLTAKLWAAEALVDKVAVEGLALHRNPAAVTDRVRGEYAVRAAAVKARADEVALEITSKIFEVSGARSTASVFCFDRFWRNVRTHSLHDPVAYQRQEIGIYVLRDEIPEPGWYS